MGTTRGHCGIFGPYELSVSVLLLEGGIDLRLRGLLKFLGFWGALAHFKPYKSTTLQAVLKEHTVCEHAADML